MIKNFTIDSTNFISFIPKHVGIPNLNILPTKRKGIYDIRTLQGQHLWLETGVSIIKSAFSRNTFKNDPNIGFVKVDLNESFINKIDIVELFVLEWLKQNMDGEIIDSFMITKDAIQEMFSYSTPTFFKVDVECLSVSVFEGYTNIPKYNWSNQEAGTKVYLVIEPLYFWIVNNKIGIKWTTRQFGLDKPADNTTKPDTKVQFDDTKKPLQSDKWSLHFDDTTKPADTLHFDDTTKLTDTLHFDDTKVHTKKPTLNVDKWSLHSDSDE